MFIDNVKPWFVTGAFPTQAQFWQWMEWLRWKDEKIDTGDLSPALLAIINSYARTIALPANVFEWAAPAGTLLEKFLIKDSGAGQAVTVRIGTTPGGNEILDDLAIDTTNPQDGIIGKDYYLKNAATVYFTLTAGSLLTLTVNIYKS
jgi:hypothetical protein